MPEPEMHGCGGLLRKEYRDSLPTTSEDAELLGLAAKPPYPVLVCDRCDEVLLARDIVVKLEAFAKRLARQRQEMREGKGVPWEKVKREL